ncbi:glycosyltransferase family 39 protein [candidate division KSB1 bacterium]|nr:glycosyltransferase family 39 protein [candidate division KSB1 bacterium]
MKTIRLSTEWVLIIGLASFKLAIHFSTNTNYELHRDTYLYLALADHPDWGYISVPPVTPMIGKLTMALFGDSAFAIGFFPALIGAVSVIVIALIVKALGGKTWAILLACTAFILSPAFLRSNTFLQPVSFDQFSWLLSGYFIVKLVQSQNPKYWIHLGILWGLAFLNKYAIVFFVLAFLLALLFTPERNLIRSKYFLLGLLLGFLIILPNLIWQHAHNWPVVGHLEELRRTQLVNVRPADFLLMQMLMNLHAVIVWLLGLFFLLFDREGGKFRVLGLTFLFAVLILMMLSGKAYYTLGVYPILFAAGGVAIEMWFARRRRFMKPVILAVMMLIFLPVLPYSLPVLSFDKMAAYAEASKKFGLEGALVWEDGRVHRLPQDYADMTGWRELAERAIEAYQSLPATERADCAIYAENYGQAGAIRYYGKPYGLPEPVCFSETFVLWAPDSVGASTLIYVNDELGEDIQYYFANVALAGEVSNVYFRENGLQIYLCQNPRHDFQAFYREKVGRLKSRYR